MRPSTKCNDKYRRYEKAKSLKNEKSIETIGRVLTYRRFVLRRAVNSIITWILVLVLNFLFFYMPYAQIGFETIPSHIAEYLEFIFVERFGPYSAGRQISTLDYIFSFSTYSLVLLAISLALAIFLGVFLGTLASYKSAHIKGKIADAALSVAALIPFTFPAWWVALTLRSYLYPPPWPFPEKWFPAFNWYSNRWIWESPWSDVPGFLLDFLNHLTLPLMTFLITFTGVYFIVTRNSLRDIYNENYIRTARAKGLSPFRVMFKHALRNALIPILSIIVLTPPLLVLSSIMTETIFSRSGLGETLLKTVIDPSYRYRLSPTPVLQAVFILFSTIIIVLHFLVDISVGFLDPRVRVDGAGLQAPDKARSVRLFPPLHRRILQFIKKFMRGFSGKFGLGVILFFAVAGLLVPYLPMQNPAKLEVERPPPLQPPSLGYPLGTDRYGRDMLAQVLWGARSSLLEGLGAVALALAIGYFVGLLSGYYNNRWIGYLLDRITDLFLSVPIIVIAVYFPNITSYTPTALKWLFAIGLTTWPFTAKLVRAAVISAKDRPFIEASRAAGAGDRHIMLRCLIPDCVPAAASSLPLLAVTALSIQSSLDFLGFERSLWSRIDPVLLAPYTSWGTILSYEAPSFLVKHWWIIFPPAICIALLSLALIAIGNKIIEVTNPRLDTSRIIRS